MVSYRFIMTSMMSSLAVVVNVSTSRIDPSNSTELGSIVIKEVNVNMELLF